jgi:RNA polymerase sigma factor (sigma-70 family)
MSIDKPPCPAYKTDAELLKDFLAKLDKAYKCLLFICYRQIIPSLERKHFHIKDDVEDIVISALAEAIQKTDGFDSVRSLLWTISTRRLIDWIRKRCRKDEDGKPFAILNPVDNWDLFENAYLASDLFMTIEFENRYRIFLGTLTARENEVLQLLYEGQTEETIGMMLGLVPASVNNLKSRILGKFHDFFGKPVSQAAV